MENSEDTGMGGGASLTATKAQLKPPYCVPQATQAHASEEEEQKGLRGPYTTSKMKQESLAGAEATLAFHG